jgi:glycosyltransferase involved in cell wall biosynthesis
MKLSVVLPVYNEADEIEKVVTGYYTKVIQKYEYSELIVAEDGSTDGTREILEKLNKKIKFRFVSGTKRKGYMKAVRDALILARGNIVFFSDTDGTHDPNDFWKLHKKMQETRADIIAGIKENRKDPFYRLFLSSIYNFIIGLFFGLWISDSNAGFKLMKKEVVDSIVPSVNHLKYGFSSELLIRAKSAGKKIEPVKVNHFPRKKHKPDQFAISKIPKVIYSQVSGMVKLKMELLLG